MRNNSKCQLSFVFMTFMLLDFSPNLMADKGDLPRVWYSTNFYGHYIVQDLEKISTACKNHNIIFVNDELRLFKYFSQYRAEYGNSAHLSDDNYSGVILAIPEQEDSETLPILKEFVEKGGYVVVLFNAVSAHYSNNVEAFKDVFNVEFKHKQITSKLGLLGTCFDGQELCHLWKGLKIGSKSWKRIGLDAYIIPEGEGWHDEVYITDKDGERHCISAVRKVGEGLIMFQVAPNNYINDEGSPGRLHESNEFFFPKHISYYDNLEAFMRLVKFASAGKVTPTTPESIPSHEVEVSDKSNFHDSKVCLVTGTVLWEGSGPAAGQLVDIYQEVISYDSGGGWWMGSSRSTSKENRHVVKTDLDGRFTVALTVPGYYEIMISPKEKPYNHLTQRFEATLGRTQNIEMVVRKYRQVKVRWCFSRESSGNFTKRGVIKGETILSPDNLCRVKFTKKGLEQVRGKSDFMLIQKDDKLYIRNFDACQTGHGIIDLEKADYESIIEIPPDSYFTRDPEPMMEPGKVILIKTYDGKGYAKLLVESVGIEK